MSRQRLILKLSTEIPVSANFAMGVPQVVTALAGSRWRAFSSRKAGDNR